MTRMCAGGGTAWVPSRVSFTGRSKELGNGVRAAPGLRERRPPLGPVARRTLV
jgi:hypothetical protein